MEVGHPLEDLFSTCIGESSKHEQGGGGRAVDVPRCQDGVGVGVIGRRRRRGFPEVVGFDCQTTTGSSRETDTHEAGGCPVTIFCRETCHRDDAVDVGLSEVLEFFNAIRRDDVIFIIITVAAADRGQDQRRIGFIDVVNDGVDPMGVGGAGAAVGVGIGERRSKKFGHVVFFVKNRTPHLSVEFFSSNGSRGFAEKPSARGGENAGESGRTKKLQTKLFVVVGIFLNTESDSMGTERGHD